MMWLWLEELIQFTRATTFTLSLSSLQHQPCLPALGPARLLWAPRVSQEATEGQQFDMAYLGTHWYSRIQQIKPQLLRSTPSSHLSTSYTICPSKNFSACSYWSSPSLSPGWADPSLPVFPISAYCWVSTHMSMSVFLCPWILSGSLWPTRWCPDSFVWHQGPLWAGTACPAGSSHPQVFVSTLRHVGCSSNGPFLLVVWSWALLLFASETLK